MDINRLEKIIEKEKILMPKKMFSHKKIIKNYYLAWYKI